MTQTFYITTPIYYANSLPHLGHLYSTIVADVIQRHKRQRGFDTYFLTGTDEHGINIQRAAEKNGRSPKEQVDYISGELKRMFHDFGLDTAGGGYDVFMRTTEPFHYEGVQHLWREIAKNKTPKGNDTIYKGFYEGWFCAPCAEFKTESEYRVQTSPEFDAELEDLIEFIRDKSRNSDEKIKKVLSFRQYENQLIVTKEEFAKLGEVLPGKIVNNYNRQFEERAFQPFFKVMEEVETELTENNDSWTASVVSFFAEKFQEAKAEGRFGTKLCLIHEMPIDWISEESYFFRLSDYDEFLIDLIESDAGLVRPEARKNEVLSFVRGGLQDLSISRQKASVSWGVPVPDDENHLMYVWLDALSNYITAIGYGNAEKQLVGFKKYWQNAVHLVGKDILRFHTVYWLSFLTAAGLALPKTVYAHGMWLDANGRKMGKTTGNVIEVDVLHQHFQVDALRYFLLREMVFGQDGKFGYENLIDRANADLASGLGNLASRTFSMITKYREGLIPSGKIAEENYINAKRAGVSPDEQELVSVIEHARDEFLRRFDNFEFSLGLETVWTIIARVDKLISDSKPWELIKDDKQAETLNAVLYRASETLRWLCVLLYPVMPDATKNIYGQIGLNGDISLLDPAALKWGELQSGTKIGETVGVFPRIDKTKVMNEIKSDAETQGRGDAESTPAMDGSEPGAVATGLVAAATNDEQPTTDESFITIDDFLKVELRVGEVKVAERIPNADKLLRFEIDLGEEQPRQILAGLAEYYEPEKLIGRKVIVVANLKPRKMRGLESQGMICAASLTEDDTPAIATFLEDVKVGARLK